VESLRTQKGWIEEDGEGNVTVAQVWTGVGIWWRELLRIQMSGHIKLLAGSGKLGVGSEGTAPVDFLARMHRVRDDKVPLARQGNRQAVACQAPLVEGWGCTSSLTLSDLLFWALLRNPWLAELEWLTEG
jgi:hypothetical protein